jgi:hypothetical protein
VLFVSCLGPVASCLWVDEMLESALVLDGIVTVIDAKHFDTQLDEHGHGKQQHEAAMQVQSRHTAWHRAPSTYLFVWPWLGRRKGRGLAFGATL